MKKLVSLILAAVLSLSLVSGAFASSATAVVPGMGNFKKTSTYTDGVFTDVAAGRWFTDNVRICYEYGLMNGVSDTVFSPSSSLTVAQVIAIAARLHSIYNTGKANFNETGDWYSVYLDYAKDNKIIAETDFTHYYKPSLSSGTSSWSNIEYSGIATRSLVAKIFSRAIPSVEFPQINQITDGQIPDVAPDESGYPAYMFYRAGVMTGRDKYGYFYPNEGITRVEVCCIVSRIVDSTLRKTFTITQDSSGNNYGGGGNGGSGSITTGKTSKDLALECCTNAKQTGSLAYQSALKALEYLRNNPADYTNAALYLRYAINYLNDAALYAKNGSGHAKTIGNSTVDSQFASCSTGYASAAQQYTLILAAVTAASPSAGTDTQWNDAASYINAADNGLAKAYNSLMA